MSLRQASRVQKQDAHQRNVRLVPGEAQRVPVLEARGGIVSSLEVGGGENCL